jgi:flagellar basal body L-ring protein FlgH
LGAQAPSFSEKEMNLEIVKQEPWSSNNSKGGSKYQPILDTLRAMDVGDSVFINFGEFQKLAGDVRNQQMRLQKKLKKYILNELGY